jgi:hypothetical protein
LSYLRDNTVTIGIEIRKIIKVNSTPYERIEIIVIMKRVSILFRTIQKEIGIFIFNKLKEKNVYPSILIGVGIQNKKVKVNFYQSFRM